MEEFKNDLIDLFKKHGILALEGRVSLDISPLNVDSRLCYADFTFKFSKAVVDRKEKIEHSEKYGLIIDSL